ncbi:MAG TPA: thioredoxin domain-containing protein [bacterium]|nr:thioredoxin domain-containing protein [bacterium]
MRPTEHRSLIGFLVAFLSFSTISFALFLIGCKASPKDTDEPASATDPQAEIYRVERGDSPLIGDTAAPVTIINFSDFQCPFSKRAFEFFERLLREKGDRVAYVYKHYPLATHREGRRAAKAAIAAARQGKFVEMYRKLFDNNLAISEENITRWAQDIGMDADAFARDYADPDTDRRLHEDVTTGNIFGVRGTPTIFINGRRISGANTGQIERVIAEEMEKGETLKKNGVTDPYAEMIKNGLARYVPPKRPLPIVPKDIYAVAIPPHAPQRGAPGAVITLILFTDLECPFCARFVSTLGELEKEFEGKLRVVSLNLPLKIHPLAVQAAKAAIAAGRQNKFWELHDTLFAEQPEWKKSANFDQYLDGVAQRLALDMVKFKKDMEDPRTMEIIQRDLALADLIGVRGTPGIFINGRYASGAFPIETFQVTIREEIERARPLIEAGMSGDALYHELIRNGKEAVFGDRPAEEDAGRVHTIKLLGQEPAVGKKNAPVTIVEFCDLPCPFCAKMSVSLDEIQKEYRDSLRIVYKQFPLPQQHPLSDETARIALSVKKLYGDDKYLALRRELFAKQSEWTGSTDGAGTIRKILVKLGIDPDKVQKEKTSPAIETLLSEDRAEAAKNNVRSTPVIFINGRKVNGPQPPERLKVLIEEALKGQQPKK